MPLPRRRLPHPQHSDSEWLFVTWHLHGSLPRSLYPPPNTPNAGRAFLWMDRHLDTTPIGPQHLANPQIAALLCQSIHHNATQGHYHLGAFVLMPNHVHLLIQPYLAPSGVLKSLKGSTARAANLLLGTTGKAFWQAESYDHWVRNEASYQRIKAYIENNPVKANLAPTPETYPYSSAYQPPPAN
jgi:putative transposase